ncbi:hypothetical protein ACIG0D_16945 [Streptomyces sp. NPDC052773]|uniref:hypothetical protein n=1 Tax=Streptomyces sp. NPDC052773 TaxID=3365693 RepID=UPI0037D16A2D
MADEQYRWLDRETAERLLRGESPDAVGADARDQAERLAEALGALAARPPLTSEELPGEAAALAAFRKARAERDEHHAALADPVRTRPSAAGLFRMGARAHGRTTASGRPRRGRPLRLALAATLAVGMVGGVAFAAGTGVLPTPFDGTEPRPAASVSAAATPDRPLLTPTPDGTHGGAGTAGPGATGREPGARGTETGRDGEDRATPSGGPGGSGRSWNEIASACRAVRDGRGLDADRRRALEGAAGGSSRVGRYCENVLRDTGAASGGSTGGSLAGTTGGSLAGSTAGQGQGKGDNGDNANGGNDAGGKGGDGKGEDGKGDDDGHGIGRPGGNGHGNAGAGQEGGSGRQKQRHLQEPEDRRLPQDSGNSQDTQEPRDRTAPTPEPSVTPPYTTR